MRSAEDHARSLRNLVGMQRGSRKNSTAVVPENVELWLATSFHGQTPIKEPTFTQAIIHTLDAQLKTAGTSITILQAHKRMMELESGNKLQCQPIYQPLENLYQKSIEIHHLDVRRPLIAEEDASTMLDLRLKLSTLDEDTLPILISWLGAHPPSVISRECQAIEPCLRAAYQYVSPSSRATAPNVPLSPFQCLSNSLKQRTLDAYRTLTQSALAILDVSRYTSGNGHSSSTNESRIRTAGRHLEEAWVDFKEQMQQNILLGPQSEEEAVVFRMLNDPTMKGMGLSQILHMRLLAMRDDGEPAYSLQSPAFTEQVDAELSDTALIFLENGVHAVEYKKYPDDIDDELLTMHEIRIGRLAKVLREASPSISTILPTDFLTLSCIGYFSERTKHRFGLKFELPSRHESSSQPISLWRALKSGKRYRLPLQKRLRLAKQISKALLHWHMAGWHHEGISSRNILFFSSPASPEPDFTIPYICGFDFSRESGKISTSRDAKDREFSVYRHPERQFNTIASHKLRHDIYSIGVVLLDLGLWDDPDESWKSTLKAKPVNHDEARQVYRNLQSFTGRLNFYVGSCYAEAVRNCLDDKYFDGATDRETTETFIDIVLNKLHDGDGL